MKKVKGLIVLILASLIALAGCGSEKPAASNSSAPPASSAAPAASVGASPSEAAPDMNKPPYVADLGWGQFKLNERIAGKIKNKEPLNIVLSFQDLSVKNTAAMLTAGMNRAAKASEEKYGVKINARLIGPTTTNPTAQISEITSLLNSGQIDALGIEPVSEDAFVNIFNQAIEQGVPTFAFNTDSPNSKRFSFYGMNEVTNGQTAGAYTVEWAKKNKIEIKNVALVTGDTTASWAQKRMQGWLDSVTKAFPNMKITGTPTNALTTGYDPNETYTKVKAFLAGHPEVDYIIHTDWGADSIAKVIADLNLKGKVRVQGFDVAQSGFDLVEKGEIVAAQNQGMDNQSESTVLGAANFLLGGTLPADKFSYLDAVLINQDNVKERLKAYLKTIQ